GDGLANDRAFIYDDATAPDQTLATGMRSLLASASPNVRECLTRQARHAAGRNSCEGPWTAQLNTGLRLGPDLLPFHTRRMDVTINLTNPLGGLDQLLHGS